jgi:hypothetical protein
MPEYVWIIIDETPGGVTAAPYTQDWPGARVDSVFVDRDDAEEFMIRLAEAEFGYGSPDLQYYVDRRESNVLLLGKINDNYPFTLWFSARRYALR